MTSDYYKINNVNGKQILLTVYYNINGINGEKTCERLKNR